MQLNEIKAPKGSRKRRKIVGRGRGSGLGCTSGRGSNGQGARSGRGVLRGSEGGQMSLIRRLPKIGFKSKRPTLNQIVKIESLEKFDKGTVITPEFLKSKGLIESIYKPIKILGNGDITKAFVVQIESVSKSAKEKIMKAGGKIEVVIKDVKVKKENKKLKIKEKK